MKRRRTKIRDDRFEANLFTRRCLVAFLGVSVMVIILVSNLYYIQVEQFQDFQTRSNANRIKFIPIAPARGLIYDRNGKALAYNHPSYNIELTPENVGNIDETIERLRQIIPISDDQIEVFHKERKTSKRYNSVPLISNITEEQVAKFSVRQHQFPGLEVTSSLKRYYPYGEKLTHVLGYVARINDKDKTRLKEQEKYNNYLATDDMGKLGIERFYEDRLHGQSGYQEVEVNSRGRINRVLNSVDPVAGEDIGLTIDIDLQIFLYDLFEGKKGSIVVLDPKDNAILGMASNPTYDPNPFIYGISTKAYQALLDDPRRPLVNRSTLGIYPPASTIKPLIAVAALQEGVITPETERNDGGVWYLPDATEKRGFRDWNRWGHGRVDVEKAIEESVDTFFYQIAYDLGIDRLSGWMNKFGFGQASGIDISEENKANMPTRQWKLSRHKKPWYQGDTIPVGIGQGYWTTTPIQLAKSMSILVNEGQSYQPHLLRGSIVKKSDSKNKEEKSYGIILNPIQPETVIEGVPQQYWDIAKRGMNRVATGRRGTARRAFATAPYQVAVKSGTAQVYGLQPNQVYSASKIPEHLRDHALFVGFAPLDNPQVIVAMVFENAGGGSSVGGPIARKIFDYMLLNKGKNSQINEAPY